MFFRVSSEVFHLVPEAFFGVVVARGAVQGEPGSGPARAAEERLLAAMAEARRKFAGQDVKAHPDLRPYREAFQRLGINPNRFPSSIEAMVSRIAKGGSLPSINPVVDLANSVGLRFTVPLGVHDLDRCSGDLEVRLARPGDVFTPFGATAPEPVEPGEVVYADGAEVRTRRWIWRQGEYSKATRESTNLFFPIDGFSGVNADRVLEARSELAALLQEITGARVSEFFVDRAHPAADLTERSGRP
ncbi:MAG: phenylalanine--tRNA ligase beta subunit-related protein [Bacillota bacterium]|nr:phenylalanine--tRNA ligase beta subunit-related protein [Bacillota bacterium]